MMQEKMQELNEKMGKAVSRVRKGDDNAAGIIFGDVVYLHWKEMHLEVLNYFIIMRTSKGNWTSTYCKGEVSGYDFKGMQIGLAEKKKAGGYGVLMAAEEQFYDIEEFTALLVTELEGKIKAVGICLVPHNGRLTFCIQGTGHDCIKFGITQMCNVMCKIESNKAEKDEDVENDEE